ncbi:Protein of unknown function [Flavobacterium indicum GPTSA100-9 = DSM 17447]|uniref:Transporter n=1 Tax=Flavobacterium indicum (strain DSM 17447 / CIP 109464 / GPTSA100-9) TaxID=1094466 RepID=H8XUM2_FLAIG|nr:transporter [Flavobacterium indicum]CCG53800.1 Protein of unknown function [Flavobacterium indicum GPTSA100-9 = DSM 17447]
MMQLKRILLTATLFSAFVGKAQFTDEVNSNRPGKSMMAFAVGKKIIQAETGVNYVSEKHNLLNYQAKGFNGELALRYGVWKEELEVIGEIQYQKDNFTAYNIETNRSAIKNAVIGVKYLFYDPFKNYEEKPNLYSWKANHRFKWRQFIPALAGYAGASFNLDKNNYFSYGPELESTVSPRAMIIAQNHFGTRWVLVTNLAYNKIGTDYASIDYVLTLTRGINQNWSAFIENQGYNGKYYSDGIFRLGAAYLFKKDMQIDASFGTNIKSTPGIFYGGIGLTWRFIKNYQEVKMAKPGTQSKMDKKMDKKAEKNKRKDSVE